MPDTDVQQADKVSTDTKVAPQIASAGKPQRVEMAFKTPVVVDDAIQNTDVPNGKDNLEDKGDEKEKVNGAVDKKNVPALTDDQLKEYFKSVGIDFENTEKLKEKLNYKPPVEFTDEQKAEQEKAKNKRRLDLFMSGGGTEDQYVAIKNIAESDLAKLSIDNAKAELKAGGFTDEQVDKIIKERYYQIDDEELEQFEEESDKAFAKRTKEYFANKLANRSSHTKKQAQDILAGLNEAVESENLQRQEEETISSNIDEIFKTVPRKSSLEIGDVNGKPISPVEYEISESTEKELKELNSTLKDPTQRNNIFFNKDGSLNYTYFSNILVENKILKSQLKTVYHEGGSRMTAEFEKVFPRSSQELGVGGSSNRSTGNGKIASYGKTQKTQPATT